MLLNDQHTEGNLHSCTESSKYSPDPSKLIWEVTARKEFRETKF